MSTAVKIKATNSPRCLLIGGGLTASLLSYLLRKSYPSIDIEVWERNATIGGRMMTLNSQATACSADIGAQYITTIPTQHSASQKM